MSNYISNKNAVLRTKIGRKSGDELPKDTVVSIGSFWDHGDLVGLGKILDGEFAELYVSEDDVDPYTPSDPTPDPMPEPDKALVGGHVHLEFSDGSTLDEDIVPSSMALVLHDDSREKEPRLQETNERK